MKQFFENLILVLQENHNLDISMFEESFLENTVTARMQELSSPSISEYLSAVALNKTESIKLIDSLSNCYSEFFRNLLTFSLLEQFILPGIFKEKALKKESEIRIWSAGCASGQEAYSIAILLDQYKSASKSKLSLSLFATDKSEEALKSGMLGRFTEETLKHVRLEHLSRYFIKEKDLYLVVPHLREMVHFSSFDLLNRDKNSPPASIYGDFDLIFCSNVLYYYNPENQKRILQKLSKSLTEGGYLITSEAEKAIVKQIKGFRQFAPPSPIFMKYS
jgi:chemotaxis methyl-accepting protein methylase